MKGRQTPSLVVVLPRAQTVSGGWCTRCLAAVEVGGDLAERVGAVWRGYCGDALTVLPPVVAVCSRCWPQVGRPLARLDGSPDNTLACYLAVMDETLQEISI